jgi:hypothetical protein
VARSLRQVLAGSLVLSAAAVGVAAWATYALEMTPTPVAAVTLTRVIAGADEPVSLAQELPQPIATNDEAEAVIEPPPSPVAALVATTPFDSEPERRTSSSAITSVSNEEAITDEPRFAGSIDRDRLRLALIERAAARDDESPFVEPMRGLSRGPTAAEEQAVFVARAAAREAAESFVEPMRGLSRAPTLAELQAAIVARAAARDDEPPIIEASYPIDASVLQTPMLRPGDYVEATISFYYCVQGETPEGGDGGAFCGAMRDGTAVYDGAAACDWSYLGQRFIIVGDSSERVYTCADTGSAVHGLHRDIWFYSAAEGWKWQLSVGTQGLLLIVD